MGIARKRCVCDFLKNVGREKTWILNRFPFTRRRKKRTQMLLLWVFITIYVVCSKSIADFEHPRVMYEGGLKSFWPNKDTRHFFRHFFQHSLLVALHTSRSDVLIVQIVLRVFLCSLLSLFRKVIASSFDENLCPPSAIFRWGNKKMRLGLDLVSKADGQAVQTVIRGFSPWQQLWCEALRCHGERWHL